MALLDRRGVVDRGWTWPTLLPEGTSSEVAHVDHLDRWLLVASISEFGPVQVVELDSRLQVRNRAHAFERGHELGIVGLKNRVVVFGRETLDLHAFRVSAAVLPVPLDGSTPGPLVLPEITTPQLRSVDETAVTTLRDTAVAVIAPHGADPGYFASVDPFTNETHVQAYPASLPSPYGGEVVHAATGMDVPGVVATCGTFQTDDRQGILLRIHDASGAQLGEPYVIEESDGSRQVYACQLGSQGTAIYVAWPRPWTNTVRVQGFRLRSR